MCAVDPMVREPGEPAEGHYDLDADSLYLRIESAGRSGAMRPEKLDELADLVASYEDRELTVVFASSDRWSAARNFDQLNDRLALSRGRHRDGRFAAAALTLTRRGARGHLLASHSNSPRSSVRYRLYGSVSPQVNVGNLIPLLRPDRAV